MQEESIGVTKMRANNVRRLKRAWREKKVGGRGKIGIHPTCPPNFSAVVAPMLTSFNINDGVKWWSQGYPSLFCCVLRSQKMYSWCL